MLYFFKRQLSLSTGKIWKACSATGLSFFFFYSFFYSPVVLGHLLSVIFVLDTTRKMGTKFFFFFYNLPRSTFSFWSSITLESDFPTPNVKFSVDGGIWHDIKFNIDARVWDDIRDAIMLDNINRVGRCWLAMALGKIVYLLDIGAHKCYKSAKECPIS